MRTDADLRSRAGGLDNDVKFLGKPVGSSLTLGRSVTGTPRSTRNVGFVWPSEDFILRGRFGRCRGGGSWERFRGREVQ